MIITVSPDRAIGGYLKKAGVVRAAEFGDVSDLAEDFGLNSSLAGRCF